ncbi:MAG: DUF1595 domain-containing protein, partial [Myxococcales bacterium]|nr:DUF1595 domain-containing protein [Myxococcales bacterium]
MTKRYLPTIALPILLGGCLGNVGNTDDSSATDEAKNEVQGLARQCEQDVPLASPMRRLSPTQYDRAVGDLLETEAQPGRAFPEDGPDAPISPDLLRHYLTAAEALGTEASTHLKDLLPCDPAIEGEEQCARMFIASFGRRAFRRPLLAEEAEFYGDLYDSRRAEGVFEDGIRLVITTMLQSPLFLYRTETSVVRPAGPGVL